MISVTLTPATHVLSIRPSFRSTMSEIAVKPIEKPNMILQKRERERMMINTAEGPSYWVWFQCVYNQTCQ